MKDLQVRLEKLRTGSTDCAPIAKLAAAKQEKPEHFTKLLEHFSVLASEVQKVIEAATSKRES
jgi:hypothetical protein